MTPDVPAAPSSAIYAMLIAECDGVHQPTVDASANIDTVTMANAAQGLVTVGFRSGIDFGKSLVVVTPLSTPPTGGQLAWCAPVVAATGGSAQTGLTIQFYSISVAGALVNEPPPKFMLTVHHLLP